jgi:hypothetical protein
MMVLGFARKKEELPPSGRKSRAGSWFFKKGKKSKKDNF